MTDGCGDYIVMEAGRSDSRGRLLIGVALALLLALTAGIAPSAFAASSLYWSSPSVIDTHTVNRLTCPSATLCVGLDNIGDVVTSTDPTGGPSAWSLAKVDNEPEPPYTEPNALNDVSCPRPAGSLCVAVGEGGVFTSTNPTGGTGAWVHAEGIGEHAHAAACASASLCVVSFGYYGEILTSIDPTGGTGAWKAVQVDGGQRIVALSCPSESLCVGLDEAGNLLTSSNPAGGAKDWNVVHTEIGADSSLTCTSVSFCIAVANSSVLSSTDPDGGAGAWVLQKDVISKEIGFGGIACASPSLCVVTGSNGEVAESTDPTSGAGAWVGAEDLDGTNRMRGAACPSESLCLLTDEAVVIGVPANNLFVSLRGMGTVTSTPIACPFGCTYSGPACPRNCDGPVNAFVPQRLDGISCIENGWFGGVNWGTCESPFPAENTVTLTATPEQGSTFNGWGGACSGSTICSVTMSSGQTVSATFASTPPPGAQSPIPTLTDISQSHARWREGEVHADADAKHNNRPVGTIFSFRLDEPARVTLSFVDRTSGRKVGETCAAQTRVNRHKPACKRTVPAGTLSCTGHSGANKVVFDGSISRSRKLRPGSYRLVIVATNSGGVRSAPKSLSFTIVK